MIIGLVNAVLVAMRILTIMDNEDVSKRPNNRRITATTPGKDDFER